MKPGQRRGVKFDLEVYKPRQMMRLAYSLHPVTGLVSRPISPDEVEGFRAEDAEPGGVVEVDWDWLELEPELGEASKLLDAVDEWNRRQRKEMRPALKILHRGNVGRESSEPYRWVERLLERPVEDGRHRILWLIVAPYLVNIKGLSVDEARGVAYDYLVLCSERRRVEGSLHSLANYYVVYAERTGLKPPTLETLRQKHPELYNIIKDGR